jgi:glycosyltransferase involved in cell wall biosynthesis
MRVKASIIIPAFNRGYIIAEAIQSVLDQTYPHIEEIIVVDDGSTDNTAEVIKSFKDARIHLLQHAKNRGVAAARNTGLKKARGGLISFLDSDDCWSKDKLALEADFLAKHVEADGVFVDRYYVGKEHIEPSAVRSCSVFFNFLKDVRAHDGIVVPRRTMYLCMLQQMPIKIQATTFRREVLDSSWKFDETWRSGEDWELLLRFTRAHCLGFIDRPLVFQRYVQDSTFYQYQKADARSLLGLFIREKSFVRGDKDALRALKKAITGYAQWLGNRCREDKEFVESAKVFLTAFRETRNPWFLAKTAAIAIPEGFRPWVKGFMRPEEIESESTVG